MTTVILDMQKGILAADHKVSVSCSLGYFISVHGSNNKLSTFDTSIVVNGDTFKVTLTTASVGCITACRDLLDMLSQGCSPQALTPKRPANVVVLCCATETDNPETHAVVYKTVAVESCLPCKATQYRWEVEDIAKTCRPLFFGSGAACAEGAYLASKGDLATTFKTTSLVDTGTSSSFTSKEFKV